MLLQARLDFVIIYSIGNDFASLVVKIKIFGSWGWSARKSNPQPHRLTQIDVLYCVL